MHQQSHIQVLKEQCSLNSDVAADIGALVLEKSLSNYESSSKSQTKAVSTDFLEAFGEVVEEKTQAPSETQLSETLPAESIAELAIKQELLVLQQELTAIMARKEYLEITDIEYEIIRHNIGRGKTGLEWILNF